MPDWSPWAYPPRRRLSAWPGITQQAAQALRRWFVARGGRLPDYRNPLLGCASAWGAARTMIIGDPSSRRHDPLAALTWSIEMAKSSARSPIRWPAGRTGNSVTCGLATKMAPRLKAGTSCSGKRPYRNLYVSKVMVSTHSPATTDFLIRRVEQRMTRASCFSATTRPIGDHEWKGRSSRAFRRQAACGKVHGGSAQVF